MEKRWAAENERILREHPFQTHEDTTGAPVMVEAPVVEPAPGHTPTVATAKTSS